jgi:hypothetical protein
MRVAIFWLALVLAAGVLLLLLLAVPADAALVLFAAASAWPLWMVVNKLISWGRAARAWVMGARRRGAAVALGVAGVALLLFSYTAWLSDPYPDNETPAPQIIAWTLGGVALCAAAGWLGGALSTGPIVPVWALPLAPEPLPSARVHWPTLALGVVLLLLVTEANADFVSGPLAAALERQTAAPSLACYTLYNPLETVPCLRDSVWQNISATLLQTVLARGFWHVSHHIQFVWLFSGVWLCGMGLRGWALRVRWWALWGALGCGAALWSFNDPNTLAVVTTVARRIGNSPVTFAWQPPAALNVLLVLIGCVLATHALAGWGWLLGRAEHGLQYLWARRGLGAAALAIVVLAAGLRAWNADNAMRVLVDEGHYTAGVRYFGVMEDVKLLTPMSGLSPFTWLYPYWQAGWMSAFGYSLWHFRAVSIIGGVLTVVLTMLLARTLFDRRTALMAGLLLATFPPHLHFSRIGILVVMDPLFGVLALWVLARAFKHNRRADYALAGVGLGLTQYFYEAGRLLFPALAMLWLLSAWAWAALAQWRTQRAQPQSQPTPSLGALLQADTQRGGQRALLKHIAMFLLGLVLIAFPVYATILATNTSVTQRLDSTRLQWATIMQMAEKVNDGQPWSQVYASFITPWWMYTALFDATSGYYGGTQPMILLGLIPLFVLGLTIALFSFPRHHGMLLLWLWLGGTSAGNMLMASSHLPARYMVVMPCLALILAVGLRYGMGWCAAVLAQGWADAQSQARARRMVWRVAAVLVCVAAAWQTVYYFGPHLSIFQQQVRVKEPIDAQDAALRALDLPADAVIVLITDRRIDEFYYAEILATFSRQERRTIFLRPDELTEAYLALLQPNRPYAFFIDYQRLELSSVLGRRFTLNLVQFSPNHALPYDKQFALFYVPEG